jgi:hypothetical protein
MWEEEDVPMWEEEDVQCPVPELSGQDSFFGQYGTNKNIPGIQQWVKDMRTPWWLADMRVYFSK